ncbi:MAG: ohrR 1 [Firmicutes bacterium]|nr:ohrR 1 [Bacillota bacterium]
MLDIFDSVCILLAKAEQKHFQFTKRMLDEKGLGITPGQLIVLYTLYKKDGVSITDLGKRSFLDNSTLTGLIDRLERLQLLSRVDVPGDRRAFSIYLTPAALLIRDDVTEVMNSVAKTMLAGCSASEVKTFQKVLHNIFNKL